VLLAARRSPPSLDIESLDIEKARHRADDGPSLPRPIRSCWHARGFPRAVQAAARMLGPVFIESVRVSES
jgi:hypothetical protein